MDETAPILIVEDSEEDYQTARRLLSKLTTRPIERCSDVSTAVSYLRSASDESHSARNLWPCIILLDLNMPCEDGRTLLARLKRDEKLRRIPVVILTTSSNPKDVAFCYSEGAAGYIVKPVDLTRFRNSLESLARYWLASVTLPPPTGVVT
jgi:CheY-like chemotaxis protein